MVAYNSTALQYFSVNRREQNNFFNMTEEYQDSLHVLTKVSCTETVQAADDVSATAPNMDPEDGRRLQPVRDAIALQIDQYLEKLLSRIRSDSVYELRKLRHETKPVSEFDSKRILEEVYEKRRLPIFAASPPESVTIGEDPHSEVSRRVKQLLFICQENAAAASPQQHMPPSVRLEIRGLIERQQVSGFLNSSHASDINRALQEGLERRHRRHQRRQGHSFSGQVRERLLEEIRGRFTDRENRPSAPMPSPRQLRNNQYQLPRRDQSSIVSQLQESPALNSLQPAERDRVLTEVNQLVQQHLVTSALSGEFRGFLELHIQNRADQVHNGVTIEDINRSLQRRSTYTASTARSFDPDMPSSAPMLEIRQEMRDMQSEILELKQLMRTSFDLQLEIQRAIRQEVAAALSSVCTQASYSPMFSAMEQRTEQCSKVVNSGNCIICLESSITSVIYRCGHMCVCMQCGLELKAQGLKCPICRAPITDIVRAYSSIQ